MPRVTYTTEGGKKSAREFSTEKEARAWIEIAKERGWSARMGKVEAVVEETVEDTTEE
jgi:hypothetical protein